MSDYFNRRGEPITFNELQALRADKSYMHVATDYCSGMIVQTVWLGADHCHCGKCQPMIFSTVIKDEAGNMQHCFRPTEHDAMLVQNLAARLARLGLWESAK